LLPVLQFIHDSGLIHRDLKPANIIHRKPAKGGTDNVSTLEAEVSRGLALVDFGAAIPTSNGPLKTDTVTGSAEYAAPEQIQGKAVPGSDIYSLGVTCIHLLTGMSPFDLFDIKADGWAWQDYLKVPVSARLRRILDKMVQREPSKRYRSAEAILTDMKYGPIPLEFVSTKPQWTLGAWAGAVVALVSLVLGSRLPSPTVPAFSAAEPVSSIPDIRFDPPPVPGFEVPEPMQPQAIEPAAVQTLVEMEQNPVLTVAVTPNGRVIASGNHDGTIRLFDKCHGKVLRVLNGHTDPVWSVAVNPEGNLLASGGADGTLKLWNLNSGELLQTWDGHADAVFSMAFSPDGEALASVGRDKTVRLWQADTGSELASLQGISGEVESAVFSPDRETLAAGLSDGTIELWNWRTGELKEMLQGHADPVWSLAISPDGQTLASGSWDKTVKLWDIHTNSLLRTLTDHSDNVKSLAFSPDGDKLASGDLSGTIKVWETNTGELTGTLKGHSTSVELAFNPQDKTLVSGSLDDTVKIWRLSPQPN
jgi:WD40 repeat protein